MGRDMKTEATHHADDLQILRDTRAAQPAPQARVEQFMARDFVSLPPWFSAAQAGKVLRQTGKTFALFRGERLATAGELEAGGAKSAASCARPLGPAIAVDASLEQAWNFLQKNRLDLLPVVLGRVLVGIITRESLAEQLPVAPNLRLAA
jgi:CBS domain-containing protein